ncbi:U3 small nucleolar RNA-associated protein [Plectosphaerella plurivora]|uniref:U3 small nucleolar RNA-associated protein n=1 Tax=Plectosphaerella plurivora TaxID=936078 RepID=A0A9P8VE86_9PEZI|nr:U3 small nucleolar RNA-associated protein [Plectosphaerella plurivora]
MAEKDDFEAFSDESPYDDSASNNSDSDSETDEFTAKLLAKNAPVAAKDAEEQELERLVLGSKATFREQLFKDDSFGDLDLLERERKAQLDITADGSGLDAVDDADLFFIDSAAPSAPGKAAAQAGKAAATSTDKADAPAWEDSDDERLTVSLAGVSQLRKLRISADEDVVSGAEYAQRLRRQFVVLNPLPKWAKESEGRPAKRRRRSSAAASDENSSDSSDEEGNEGGDDLAAAPLEKLLRDVRSLAGRGGADAAKKKRLRPEVIDIQRTRPIPDQHKAAVSNLSFHPEFPVLLSSSVSSVLYLHHINPTAHPTPNPMLTSVQAQQVDVRRAEFLYPQGDQIFFAGRRRYFHSWDLQSGVVQKTTQVQGHRLEHRSMESFRLSPCGRYMGIVATTKKGGGIVNIISVTSRQWIAAARMDSRHGIASFAWWSNGEGMTVLGRDGSVGEYSMESRRFLGIWHDEGCVGGLVVALGGHHGPAALGGDRWVAVGSSSGVANIYDRNEIITRDAAAADPDSADALVFKENPEPAKRLEQLVTSITVLTFSPDGQLLAFGSHQKQDALRLVHLPSCTVYRNWPTEKTPLGRVTCVAFGKNSDLLAVGNDNGKIRLWEIRS